MDPDWTQPKVGRQHKPYTIYARLNKNNKSDGYLVFAPKEADGDNWLDKYAYVTMQGLATGTANKNVSDYWYVKARRGKSADRQRPHRDT